MRHFSLLTAAVLALPAAAQEQAPFLEVLTDPTNAHFAAQSLGKDVPLSFKKLLSAHPALAAVKSGPEVASAGAARDYAGKERARFYVFAQCGIVIELLKQCDAHIKYCAHQCEAWLYQTEGGRQLGHAKVTGEKGGTDAVKKLIAQLPALLEALREPVEQLVAQERAEREAKRAAERVQKELEKAERDRKLAEANARGALQAEEQRRIAQAEKELREARTEESRKAAQEKLDAARRVEEEAKKAQLARLDEMRAAEKAREEEGRLRKQAEEASARLAKQREKRLALERVQAGRTINLVPGQTVAVLEVENDLVGGARNQVNFSLLTDNLRKRVSKSGLGLLVMDRDAIFQILSANEKKVLECSANCEVQLGQILRSDYVISGRLGKQGAAFRLYLLMYRSQDGALLADAVAVSDELAALDKKAAMASTDLLSVFPLPR
jgi:hypothetical protein